MNLLLFARLQAVILARDHRRLGQLVRHLECLLVVAGPKCLLEIFVSLGRRRNLEVRFRCE